MSTYRQTNVVKTDGVSWKYKGRADSNKADSTLVYTDKFEGWASRVPRYYSKHPDIPALLLVEIEAERKEGGQVAVTLKYETSDTGSELPGRPAGSAAVETYAIQTADGEEHILTHVYAADIVDSEKKALMAISNGSEADEAGNQWEAMVTSDRGLALLAKIRKGNVAVPVAGIFYVAKKVSRNLSDLNREKFDKIDTPPGPVFGAANSWLYRGGDAEPDPTGQTWQITRKWQYSPNGWDTDLFSSTP